MKWLSSSLALAILDLLVVGVFFAGNHFDFAFVVVAFAFMFSFALSPVAAVFAIRDLLFRRHRIQALISLIVTLPLAVLLYLRIPQFLV